MSDSNKWKNPFFKSLPTEYKLFWIYILDDCDHAGVWQVDMEIAQIKLGTKLSLQKARGLFKERVVEFDNGTRWFLPDFIAFQYGELCEKNKMTKPVLSVLTKYDLMGHLSPINGVKVKDKVQVMVKNTVDEQIQFCEKILVDSGLHSTIGVTWGIDKDGISRMVNAFESWLMLEEKKHPTYSEYKKHFVNWGSKKFAEFKTKPDRYASLR
jgi:hypothetical protein